MAAAKPTRLDYSPQGGRQFESIERSIASVGDTSITNGRKLSSITLTTTGTQIQHGLGKGFSGWFLVRKRGAGDVYEIDSTDESKFLGLKVSAATVTVDVWVY